MGMKMILPIVDQTLILIKYFEGFVPRPYICPAGKKTVGWGHRLTDKEDKELVYPLDEQTAEVLLESDIKGLVLRLMPMVKVPLENHQWVSLLSFSYNVGLAAFQRSTLRQKLNRDDLEGVAYEFHRWIFTGTRKIEGLIKRRKIEALIFAGKVNVLSLCG